MQSDKKLDNSFVSTKSWDGEQVAGQQKNEVKRFTLPSLERGKLSFSGKERNHLFQNLQGSEFQDISGVSGLDTPQDGRSFAIWDYDRDGWQDIALLNINTPVLSLFRNQQGTLQATDQKRGNMVAFKFIGGNREALPSTEFGCRDGYGVEVTVQLPNQSLVQQLRCGEGLAAQNSRYMFFGIGEGESVEKIKVRWPSGITQSLENVPAGDLVTVFENAAESSNGTGFDRSRYIIEGGTSRSKIATAKSKLPFELSNQTDAKLTVITSVATWCPNCLGQIPQLNLLRDQYTDTELTIVGAMVDKNDSDEMAQNYLKEHQPPYTLAEPWSETERESFNLLINARLESDVLPATMIINDKGEVVSVIAGVPTVSDIARLISE